MKTTEVGEVHLDVSEEEFEKQDYIKIGNCTFVNQKKVEKLMADFAAEQLKKQALNYFIATVIFVLLIGISYCLKQFYA